MNLWGVSRPPPHVHFGVNLKDLGVKSEGFYIPPPPSPSVHFGVNLRGLGANLRGLESSYVHSGSNQRDLGSSYVHFGANLRDSGPNLKDLSSPRSLQVESEGLWVLPRPFWGQCEGFGANSEGFGVRMFHLG